MSGEENNNIKDGSQVHKKATMKNDIYSNRVYGNGLCQDRFVIEDANKWLFLHYQRYIMTSLFALNSFSLKLLDVFTLQLSIMFSWSFTSCLDY